MRQGPARGTGLGAEPREGRFYTRRLPFNPGIARSPPHQRRVPLEARSRLVAFSRPSRMPALQVTEPGSLKALIHAVCG